MNEVNDQSTHNKDEPNEEVNNELGLQKGNEAHDNHSEACARAVTQNNCPQDSAELRNTEQERHQEGISRLSRTSCSAARWAKLMTPSFLSQVSQAHFLRCCF